MKKTFLSLIVIILFASLLHCENKSQLKKERIYSVGISPGIVTSLNLGMGHTHSKNDKIRERFSMLHVGTNVNHPGDIVIAGFYGKTNYYIDEVLEGVFYNTTFGLDVIRMPHLNLDPGGAKDSNKYNIFIFPNARLGIGYASKTAGNSGLEFNFEMGITAVIMSLNVSYVF